MSLQTANVEANCPLRWNESRNLIGKDFQMIGLSATIGSPDKVAQFLVGNKRPVEIIRVPVAKMVKLQILYPKPTEEDARLAGKLYTHPEVAARLRIIRDYMIKHKSVLLFTNTRSISEVLASRLQSLGHRFPSQIHHGSLAKPSRIAAETGLKSGELKGLIATSSLELGIDVGTHRPSYPVHESEAGYTAYSTCWQSRTHLRSRCSKA